VGRWRPPVPHGSPYITATGATALKSELERLWRRERREVVAALSAAAAEGDRSENAEYTYRKKQLGEIDRRIRYLSKRLDVLKIVDRPPTDASRVRFGATVGLQRDSGAMERYRIVGVDETDAERGWISVDSPLAIALLGKGMGDEFSVVLPAGERHFEVVGIEYSEPY
jgi:transcription elongation factor GreB